eukprot:Sspe_Gene.105408::Locus_82443_Transcript_1_1_Confidence_1.000_Length_501::g.105408::m.105408
MRSEVLAFRTSQVVVIRDHLLCGLGCFLKFCVVVYLVAAVMIGEGYYTVTEPRGTAMLTVQMPKVKDIAADLPYCSNTTHPPIPGVRLPCEYWSTPELNVPVLGNHLFITTRVTKSEYTFPCHAQNKSCIAGYDEYPMERLLFHGFVAGVEDATVY